MNSGKAFFGIAFLALFLLSAASVGAAAPSSIVYVSPSPANASFRNYNYSYINASFTNGSVIDTCLLNYVYANSTNVNFTMNLITNVSCWFNVTSQAEGQANFTVYINNTASQWGSNLTYYYFTVDKTVPASIAYVSPSPANGSNRNYNYSYINVTFTEANPDTCLLDYVYSNSTEANFTMTRSGNVCYFNVTSQPVGEANFTVYVNDSAGNWGSNLTYYYFTVDKTVPSSIAYVDPTPLNSSTQNYTYAYINVTFTETYPDTCLLAYVYGNSTSVNLTMTRSGNVCSLNVTPQTINGETNFTVYVNDTAGNWGSNLTHYYFIISQYTNPFAGTGGSGSTPTPTPTATPTPAPTYVATATPTPRPTSTPTVAPTEEATVTPEATVEQPTMTPAAVSETRARAGVSTTQEAIALAKTQGVNAPEAERLLALAQQALNNGQYAVALDYAAQADAALQTSVATAKPKAAGGLDWTLVAVIIVLVLIGAAYLYSTRKKRKGL